MDDEDMPGGSDDSPGEIDYGDTPTESENGSDSYSDRSMFCPSSSSEEDSKPEKRSLELEMLRKTQFALMNTIEYDERVFANIMVCLMKLKRVDLKEECLGSLMKVAMETSCACINESTVKDLADNMMMVLLSDQTPKKDTTVKFICLILEKKWELRVFIKPVFFKALELFWGREEELKVDLLGFQKFLEKGPLVALTAVLYECYDDTIAPIENILRTLSTVNIELVRKESTTASENGIQLVQSLLLATFGNVRLRSMHMELCVWVCSLRDWRYLGLFLFEIMHHAETNSARMVAALELISRLALSYKEGIVTYISLFEETLSMVFDVARRNEGAVARQTLVAIVSCNIQTFRLSYTEKLLADVKIFIG